LANDDFLALLVLRGLSMCSARVIGAGFVLAEKILMFIGCSPSNGLVMFSVESHCCSVDVGKVV
jgi:hypothetical protein